MEDNGLACYLLAPDEHHTLPNLVDEVLAKRSEIAADLHTIRARLYKEAQRSMESIRDQIEQRGPRHRRTGPKVSIVVKGSGSTEKDQQTLASCASQTYEDKEVLLVDAVPQDNAAARLQQAIASASGEYLTWVDGGDWFAHDGLDCLMSRLESEPDWDVIYADYYAMNKSNLPEGHHTVPGPDKLFRRDAVGPCFLLRKSLLSRLNLPSRGTQLVAYSLWLQANANSVLVPFHAPIFYSARPIRSRVFIEQEREVRRLWRQPRPVWQRVVWRVIDSDLGEQLAIRPLARLRDLFRRKRHA